MKIKSLLLGLLMLVGFQIKVQAQSEDEGIKACINNYLDGVMQGDTARLNRAFHPTALLRSVNTNTGALQDLSVRKFVATTPAGGIQTRGGSTKLVSYSYIGVSALATVELRFGDFKYVDLLSMLKFGDNWKIVSRVFSRADLDATVKGTGAAPSTGAPAASKPPVVKKSSANVKPKADDGW
ncbi:nuclear transport factor 2 family protein [Flectobacillus rivi]|uniref:Nuclear transport factor 2 family protein n=1 Tax=Flectobacillus rivi TaxID=2984209 RepID=A0ABT6YXM6_9BACT|nr:nuclear transport factor 2 family protein [Flectobacillus rivi]MDI9873633.1 nuclear transport factor 2 family protein [Flectobacillus rivi]